MEFAIFFIIGLAMGYVMGLMQGGINITHTKPEEEQEGYNVSVGNQEYMDYFEQQRRILENGYGKEESQ